MKCAARIKPGFLPHFIILISQAVRGRTGQAAFLRFARAGPSAQVGWRQGKVFSQVFFKKLVGFGVKPQDLLGYKGRYVATSVGAGRLPLADSTPGGSRDRRFRPRTCSLPEAPPLEIRK